MGIRRDNAKRLLDRIGQTDIYTAAEIEYMKERLLDMIEPLHRRYVVRFEDGSYLARTGQHQRTVHIEQAQRVTDSARARLLGNMFKLRYGMDFAVVDTDTTQIV